MPTEPKSDAARREQEHELDRRARRDAARRNESKGIGRNLEEAIALVRAGKEFGAVRAPTVSDFDPEALFQRLHEAGVRYPLWVELLVP